MIVTADSIKDLREKTGAGFMDCKKALAESAGDFEKAIEILRKKGIATAAKREGREAKEGLIGLKTTGTKAALVELNCETDFVAKTDGFKNLLSTSLEAVFTKGESILEDAGFKASVVEISGKTGEKLVAKRARVVSNAKGFVAGYLHSNQRVGVLVEVECANATAELEAAAREIAMQIAAMKPIYVSRTDVPAHWVAKEKEILLEQSKDALAGKPEAMKDKIIEGKLSKRYEEVCLLEQKFIRDDKQTVGRFFEAVSKKAAQPAKIVSFVRFELGGTE